MTRRALLLLLASGFGLSCAPPNTLEGSLSDEMSLGFTSVSIQSTTGAISLAYQTTIPGASGLDTIFEIIADTSGVTLGSKGGSINLAQTLPDGLPRGTFTRAVHNDPRSVFPPIVRGTLTFDQNPTVGAKVTGSFDVLFGESGVSDIGSGRTVIGTFSATVEAAASN